jgi:hypothetical protein
MGVESVSIAELTEFSLYVISTTNRGAHIRNRVLVRVHTPITTFGSRTEKVTPGELTHSIQYGCGTAY